MEILHRRYHIDQRSSQPQAQVLRSKRSLLIPEVTEEFVRTGSRDEEHRALIDELLPVDRMEQRAPELDLRDDRGIRVDELGMDPAQAGRRGFHPAVAPALANLDRLLQREAGRPKRHFDRAGQHARGETDALGDEADGGFDDDVPCCDWSGRP